MLTKKQNYLCHAYIYKKYNLCTDNWVKLWEAKHVSKTVNETIYYKLSNPDPSNVQSQNYYNKEICCFFQRL